VSFGTPSKLVTVPGREFQIGFITGILLACQQYGSDVTFMICIKAIGANPIQIEKGKMATHRVAPSGMAWRRWNLGAASLAANTCEGRVWLSARKGRVGELDEVVDQLVRGSGSSGCISTGNGLYDR
jgi:streptogramin lyase